MTKERQSTQPDAEVGETNEQWEAAHGIEPAAPEWGEVARAGEGQRRYSPVQLRRFTGATPRQLTYWNQIGFVVPAHRTPGGDSRYDEAQLFDVLICRRLIDGGLSFQRARKLVGVVRDIVALSLTAPWRAE